MSPMAVVVDDLFEILNAETWRVNKAREWIQRMSGGKWEMVAWDGLQFSFDGPELAGPVSMRWDELVFVSA